MVTKQHLLFAVVIVVLTFDQAPAEKYIGGGLRIVGGDSVSIEDYPYQVYVVINDSIACGGSIIGQSFILTAAHCVWGAQKIEIRAGSTWYNGADTSIPTDGFRAHPGYIPESDFNFDVAIVHTAEPIEFTNTIQPIPLPEKNRPMVEGSIVTVAGWGKLAEDRPMSGILMAVQLPVFSTQNCAYAYRKNTGNIEEITENMWCAGMPFSGKDACAGDSGGPAVQDGMVVGIVSFGFGCAERGLPGVYTNVAAPHIRDFINLYTGL